MSLGYALFDQELHTVVQYIQLGKRFFDKLVRFTRFSGAEDLIIIHLEVQGSPQTEYAERMFVYNYRLYEHYRRSVASMAVLAVEADGWHPISFGVAYSIDIIFLKKIKAKLKIQPYYTLAQSYRLHP